MKTEKALINDHLVFQKYPKNFKFQLFLVLKKFTREISCFFKK